MGVFEMAKFEAGTKGLMDAVVEATKAGKTTIIGKNPSTLCKRIPGIWQWCSLLSHETMSLEYVATLTSS